MKMKLHLKKFFAALLSIFGFVYGLSAQQIVSTTPTNPTDNEEITLVYDATIGNGGLVGATSVYVHTGVILSSQVGTDWTNVVGNWGKDDGIGRMTAMGSNKWQIKISPRTYYSGIAANRRIFRLAMVFRNADGTKEGKNNGADIFVDLRPTGLGLTFRSPAVSANPIFIAQNETININADISAAANVTIFDNTTQIATLTNVTNITRSIAPTAEGGGMIRIVTTAGTQTVNDTIRYVRNPQQVVAGLPAGVQDGINYVSNTSAVLVLAAPLKKFVYVIGEFNNWQYTANSFMRRTPDGNRYWLQINDLVAGQEYAFQYFVDGEIRTTDPYCTKILDGWNDGGINSGNIIRFPNLKAYPAGVPQGIVGVLQTAKPAYNWKVANFRKPEKRDMVVYELLFRDFTVESTIKAATARLQYIKDLGTNVIELMPVNEFSGNDSWGYNPINYFAPDKFYGTENDLKEFIDKAHEMGMAVVIDMVLNQADGAFPMVQMYWDAANRRPAANNPWFNPTATHPFSVFYDFNHESDWTKAFVKRVNEYWLREFKVDGYRFDLSKGFTQKVTLGVPNEVSAWSAPDASRIAIWKRISDEIWAVDNTAYVILEHLGDNVEEKELGEYKNGMIFWGNINGDFQNATAGRSGNLNWTFHGTRGWNQPGVLAYMESHDEERLMFNALQNGSTGENGYNIKTLNTALERMKLGAAFFFPIPGPKLIWQFGEVGYDVSINENGRVGRKPVRWNYFDEPARKSLYKTYQALINLRKMEAFRTLDVSQVSLNLNGTSLKRMTIRHSTMNVHIIGNFSAFDSEEYELRVPNTGTWYDYFSGDTINVRDVNEKLTMKAGQWHLLTSVQLQKPESGLSSWKMQRFVPKPTEPLSSADEIFSNSLAVFPNPSASGIFHITADNTVANGFAAKIFDSLGKEVATKQSWKQGLQTTLVIDIQHLPTGVYVVEISDGKRKAVKKVVRE
jgi:glycosidase